MPGNTFAVNLEGKNVSAHVKAEFDMIGRGLSGEPGDTVEGTFNLIIPSKWKDTVSAVHIDLTGLALSELTKRSDNSKEREVHFVAYDEQNFYRTNSTPGHPENFEHTMEWVDSDISSESIVAPHGRWVCKFKVKIPQKRTCTSEPSKEKPLNYYRYKNYERTIMDMKFPVKDQDITEVKNYCEYNIVHCPPTAHSSFTNASVSFRGKVQYELGYYVILNPQINPSTLTGWESITVGRGFENIPPIPRHTDTSGNEIPHSLAMTLPTKASSFRKRLITKKMPTQPADFEFSIFTSVPLYSVRKPGNEVPYRVFLASKMNYTVYTGKDVNYSRGEGREMTEEMKKRAYLTSTKFTVGVSTYKYYKYGDKSANGAKSSVFHFQRSSLVGSKRIDLTQLQNASFFKQANTGVPDSISEDMFVMELTDLLPKCVVPAGLEYCFKACQFEVFNNIILSWTISRKSSGNSSAEGSKNPITFGVFPPKRVKKMLPLRVELRIATLLVWRLTSLAIEAY